MSLRNKRGASPVELSLSERPKRLRTDASMLTGSASDAASAGLTTRSGRAGQQAPVDPTEIVAKTPHELEQVRQKGLTLWERVTQSKDAEGRYFADPFYKLPSRREYPDYYEIIKNPLSLDEVKKKLDKLEYTTIRAIRDDLNHVFVNAQRYNASGSPIFMDARQLKRVLKETFDPMSGTRSLDDDDQPSASSAAGSSRPTLLPDPNYAKRGPTIKPWLSKKLAELRLLKDQTGRVLTDAFEELPDRDQYPEYYQVITHPMSLGLVATKIHKRNYTSVQQFREDVCVIFANAMYYNEESSRIWKDAKLLQNHFNELMKEQPPEFLPPRKYHTKRMREQEAAGITPTPSGGSNRRQRSQGMSEPPEGDDGSDEDEVDYTPNAGGIVQGYPAAAASAPPAPLPSQAPHAQAHVQPGSTPAQTAAQYLARPIAPFSPAPAPSSIAGPISAAAGFIPQPTPYNSAVALPPVNPVGVGVGIGMGSVGALPLANGTKLSAESVVRPLARLPLASITSSTTAQTNGTTSVAPRESSRRKAAQSQSPSKAGAVKGEPASASTNADGAASLLTKFEIFCSADQAPLVLTNESIRQHALVIPSSLDRVRLVSHFVVVDAETSSKPAEGSDATTTTNKALPSVKVSTRPDGSAVLANTGPSVAVSTDADADAGGGTVAVRMESSIGLRDLMTAIEIIVTPPSTSTGSLGTGSTGGTSSEGQKEEGTQVYRLFLTKAS